MMERVQKKQERNSEKQRIKKTFQHDVVDSSLCPVQN